MAFKMCSRRVLGKNIYLINSHTCILQITFFPGTNLLVMQSLLMLLSSSLLTCDIYSIKNIYIYWRHFCFSLLTNSALRMYIMVRVPRLVLLGQLHVLGLWFKDGDASSMLQSSVRSVRVSTDIHGLWVSWAESTGRSPPQLTSVGAYCTRRKPRFRFCRCLDIINNGRTL